MFLRAARYMSYIPGILEVRDVRRHQSMVLKISFHIQDFNVLLYLVRYHSSTSFYTFKGKSFRGLFGTPLNVKDLSKP